MDESLWLNGVQGLRAPGHGTGMPMLQQPPGGQDHRKIVIGLLIRRRQGGGNQFSFAVMGGEAFTEDDFPLRGCFPPSHG